MLGVRQLAVVSPAWPEGEERGPWDTGDPPDAIATVPAKPVPDSNQPAPLAYVRRLEMAVDKLENQVDELPERIGQQQERRLTEQLGYVTKSEANLQTQIGKQEAQIKLLIDEVRDLKADRRQVLFGWTVIKWIAGVVGIIFCAGFSLAIYVVNGNNELLSTITTNAKVREAQQRNMSLQLEDLKDRIGPVPGESQVEGAGPPK